MLKRETSQPTVENFRGISAVEGPRIGRRGRGDEAGMRAKVQGQGWVHDSRTFFLPRGETIRPLAPKPVP